MPSREPVPTTGVVHSKHVANEKRIVLCADDFSLNAAVNAGIVELLAAQRLSATGCMTQSSGWRQDAHLLLPFRGQADIGLHFNLTHPFPGALCFPLTQLMWRSQLRLLPWQRIRDSLRAQLDAFEDALGMPPDFIDGHQHVHQFPQVRELLVDECLRRYRGRLPWVRSLGNMPGESGLKTAVLRMMGATALQHLLLRHGFAHNSAFGGVYDLRPDPQWGLRLQGWLQALPDKALIMCHPASALDASDVIAAARVEEYWFLASAQWPALMADCRIVLGRQPKVSL